MTTRQGGLRRFYGIRDNVQFPSAQSYLNVRLWLRAAVPERLPRRRVRDGKRTSRPRCRLFDGFRRLCPRKPTWHQQPIFVCSWPISEIIS